MLDGLLELIARWRWQEIFVTTLILLLGWVGSRVFLHFVERVGTKLARRTASTLDDYLLDALRPAAHLILLFGIRVALSRYDFRFLGIVHALIFVVGLALVVFTVIRVVSALLRWYGEVLSKEKEGETLAREMLPLADKVAKVLILAVGLVVGLENFGIELKSVLVTLGVGSLAIGLALQDTLANMFGGFTIMIDRPFRIGDRIQLQTGELGDVQTIGIRSTRIVTMEGNILIIPNAHLVKSTLTNHSFPDSRARIQIEVGVSYNTDTEAAKRLMLQAAREHPDVLKEPPPQAFFKAFGDSALLLILVCYASSFMNRMGVIDSINSILHARFKAAGIDIPYPARTVYLQRENL